MTGRIRGVPWWRWLTWACSMVYLIPWWLMCGFWEQRRTFITPWGVTADGGEIVIPWRDVVPMDEMPALLARLRAEKEESMREDVTR
jgi:hypothetical protein